MSMVLNSIQLENYGNNCTEARIIPESFTEINKYGSHSVEDVIVRIDDLEHPSNGQGFKNISSSMQQIEIPIDTQNYPGKWFKLESRHSGDVALFVQVGSTGWVKNDESEISRIATFGTSKIGITLGPNSILWDARAKSVDVGSPTLIYDDSQSSEYFIIQSYLETGKRDVRGGRGHFIIEISRRSDFRDPKIISMNTQDNIPLFFEEKYNLSSGVPTTPISGTKALLTKGYAGSDSYTPVGANIGTAGWVTTLGINKIDTFENFYFRVYVIDGNWE